MVPFFLPVSSSLSLVCGLALAASGLDRPLHVAAKKAPASVAGEFVPRPTCAAPRPDVVSRGDLPQLPFAWQLAANAVELAESKPQPARELDVQTILANWQKASSGLLPPSREMQKRLLHQHQDALNGHQVSLLVQLSGPIEQGALARRYRWTLLQQNAASMEIAAEPLDEIERLFFRRCTVTLDAKDHLPVSVAFTGRDGAPALVDVQTQRDIELLLVRQSAPRPLVVTAALQITNVGQLNPPRPIVQRSPTARAELGALTEELRDVLLRWEAASHGPGQLSMEVSQRSLDKATGTSTPSQGVLVMHGRNDYRVRIVGRTTAVDATADGESLTVSRMVLDEASHCWVCRTSSPPAEVVRVSAEVEAASPCPDANAPLPFVLDLNAADLAHHFEWTIVGNEEQHMRLRGRPVTVEARSSYRQVEVTLNRQTFRPAATRILFANGDEQTQTFRELAIEQD